MGVQRRSLLEFHTVCYEEENILNERPLGRIPDEGSEVKSLTPIQYCTTQTELAPDLNQRTKKYANRTSVADILAALEDTGCRYNQLYYTNFHIIYVRLIDTGINLKTI